MIHDFPLYIIAKIVVTYFVLQAEAGIRDATVTGVQTCALPIWRTPRCPSCQTVAGNHSARRGPPVESWQSTPAATGEPGRSCGSSGCSSVARSWPGAYHVRSEERRVGEEGSCRACRDHASATSR